MHRNCFQILGAMAAMLVLSSNSSQGADAELEQRASWRLPHASEVRAELQTWLEKQQLDEATELQATTLWPPEATGDRVEVLDRLVEVLAIANPEARKVVDYCKQPRRDPLLPEFTILKDEKAAPMVRNNLRLHFARWLSQNKLYDESLEHLAALNPENVCDPAALLFYKGIAHHRLLQKDACLPVVRKLMENEGVIPRRYLILAQLMEQDIKPIKPDSLEEVERLMESVKRRLGLGRAGTRVRKEEEEIIKKLDKMIEELEEQQKKQKGGQGNGPGRLQPSNPANDSTPMGGKGDGNVDQKNIGNASGWGDLPLKKRQETLQEITKDLPAHYRAWIEEYFRRLARESEVSR